MFIKNNPFEFVVIIIKQFPLIKLVSASTSNNKIYIQIRLSRKYNKHKTLVKRKKKYWLMLTHWVFVN